METQCRSKWPHIAIFEAFIKKNHDASYIVKDKVCSSALLSAILYGMETWLSLKSIKVARSMYMQYIWLLLGVHKNTTRDLCPIEAGQSPLAQRIKVAQKKMIFKMISEWMEIQVDPFCSCMEHGKRYKDTSTRYIQSLKTFDSDVGSIHPLVHPSIHTCPNLYFEIEYSIDDDHSLNSY